MRSISSLDYRLATHVCIRSKEALNFLLSGNCEESAISSICAHGLFPLEKETAVDYGEYFDGLYGLFLGQSPYQPCFLSKNADQPGMAQKLTQKAKSVS